MKWTLVVRAGKGARKYMKDRIVTEQIFLVQSLPAQCIQYARGWNGVRLDSLQFDLIKSVHINEIIKIAISKIVKMKFLLLFLVYL